MSDRPRTPDDDAPPDGDADSAPAAESGAGRGRTEPTWPTFERGEQRVVSELAAEHQGAEAPFGSDIHPPIDLDEYRRNSARGRAADVPEADEPAGEPES